MYGMAVGHMTLLGSRVPHCPEAWLQHRAVVYFDYTYTFILKPALFCHLPVENRITGS
jgi:hypothetical protein